MFGWLRRRRQGGAPPTGEPEVGYQLRLEGERITLIRPGHDPHSVELGELRGIAIETNDTGPAGDDVWWLLFGPDDKVAMAYPQGIKGEQPVMDKLTRLPAFDHEQMIKAMVSTSNAVFPVWRVTGQAD